MIVRTLATPLALVIGLVALPACGPKVDPEAEQKMLSKQLAEAQGRLRNEKTKDAEKLLLTVLAKQPNNAEALAGMAQVRYLEKAYNDAESLFKKAIAAGKADDAQIHYRLGHVYSMKDDHPSAGTAYLKAFELDGENSDYGLAAGQALKKTKQWAKAQKVFEKVADLDPKAQFVFTDLGDTLREQGQLDDALRKYMKAQNTYRSDKMARAGAAMVYEAKGDNAHALDEWSGYIRMDCCSEFSNNVAKKKVSELKVADGGEAAADAAPAADDEAVEEADEAAAG